MEFEFFLAEQLHMSVGKMREEMSNFEFVQWYAYYGKKQQLTELESKRAGK